MANTIKLKRGTSTPSTSDIVSGEVAIDTSAKKLYINDSGTIKEIGGSGITDGDKGDITVSNSGASWFLDNGVVTTAIINNGAVNASKILDDVVSEVKLNVSNSPTDGYFLQAQSGNTGGLTWAAVDLSAYVPLAGGTMTGNLLFGDDVKAIFGAGSDLQIFHDSSETTDRFRSTGTILLQPASGENGIAVNANGSVDLCFNGTKKAETVSGGFTITGTATADTISGLSGDHTLTSSGSNSILSLNSTGTNSRVKLKASGSNGSIQMTAVSDIKFYSGTDFQTQIFEAKSGGVDVYGNCLIRSGGELRLGDDDNSNRVGFKAPSTVSSDQIWTLPAADGSANTSLTTDGSGNLSWASATDSTKLPLAGGTITGNMAMTGNVFDFADGKYLRFGTGNDFEMFFNGTDQYLKSVAGKIRLQVNDGEDSILCYPNGQVEIFFDNSKKIETHTNGVTITGTLSATAFSGAGSGLTGISNLASDCVGAAQIQDNVVREEKLQVSNAPTNGYVLTARSGNTGGMTWEAVSASDNTKLPLAGGTLTGNVRYNDSVEAQFGSSGDFRIYHDGSSGTYLKEDSGTGHLNIGGSQVIIQNADMNEVCAKFIADGGTELYYDNSKKFETASYGAQVFGNLVVGTDAGEILLSNPDGFSPKLKENAGSLEFYTNNTLRMSLGNGGNLLFQDDRKAEFGASSDLQIFHDGNHSFIKDTGTGNFYITGSYLAFMNAAGNEYMLDGSENGAASLFYDGANKLQTTSTGVTVTGTITPSSHLVLGDQVEARFGASSDLTIEHDGANSFIRDGGTGKLIIKSNNQIELVSSSNYSMIEAVVGGATRIFYDGVQKFATDADGVTITGQCAVTSHVAFPDHSSGYVGKAVFGGGDDLVIYHNGSNNYIVGASGQTTYIGATNGEIQLQPVFGTDHGIRVINNGAVEAYYDGTKKLETYSSGVKTYGGYLRIVGDEGGTAELNLYADEGDDAYDVWQVKAGGSSDFYIAGWNGGSYETSIKATGNGAVELYYNDTKKFETNAEGVRISGYLEMLDSQRIQMGTGDDLQLFHDGTNSHINNYTGIFKFGSSSGGIELNTSDGHAGIHINDNDSVELYFDNGIRLNTSSSGATCHGSLSETSDIALKEDIEVLSNSLTNLKQLNGYSYKFKETGIKSLGLTAQEVEKVFPDLVEGKEGEKSLHYSGLIAPILEAIKELSIEVETLKNKVTALEAS